MAIINVNCSNPSTVQTALNNAAPSDTIQCNATSSLNWTSKVTLPNNKNITFDGNNCILSGTNWILSIPSTASYYARVTRVTFRGSGLVDFGGGGSPTLPPQNLHPVTNKPWRIDHCTFDGTNSDTNAIANAQGPGLIDHCNWIHIPAAKETIWNGGPDNSWSDVITPGNPEGAVFIEDCTMSSSQYEQLGTGLWSASSVMHSFRGARVVLRHSTLYGIMLDCHGNYYNPPSTRWWEAYENTLTNSIFCFRGGSGIVFNNHGTGSQGSNIYFVDEAANSSTDNGIGKGQVVSGANIYMPIYIWNNTGPSYEYNTDGCSTHIGTVNWGHDVIQASSGITLPTTCSSTPNPQGFWKTDENILYKCTAPNTWTKYYIPYTYPHPLQNLETCPPVIASFNLQVL